MANRCHAQQNFGRTGKPAPAFCIPGGRYVITIDIDMREFTRKARQMGVFANDQLPYAISRTLNDTMHQDVRPGIIGPTWSSAFTVRRSNFARASINVIRPGATKANWSAGVFDRLGRGHLREHADGGTKRARGMLAIPNQESVRLHARGKTPKPRALDRRIKRRALRVIRGKGIFEGRGGRLHAWFWFRPSAQLDKRFRFREDFKRLTEQGCARRFPVNLQHAVRTSFR